MTYKNKVWALFYVGCFLIVVAASVAGWYAYDHGAPLSDGARFLGATTPEEAQSLFPCIDVVVAVFLIFLYGITRDL